MADRFKDIPVQLNSPVSNLFAIVPSDVTVFTQATRGIYVGTTGDLVVMGVNDTAAVTLKTAAVGWHPIRAKQVMAATTAGNVVGGY